MMALSSFLGVRPLSRAHRVVAHIAAPSHTSYCTLTATNHNYMRSSATSASSPSSPRRFLFLSFPSLSSSMPSAHTHTLSNIEKIEEELKQCQQYIQSVRDGRPTYPDLKLSKLEEEKLLLLQRLLELAKQKTHAIQHTSAADTLTNLGYYDPGLWPLVSQAPPVPKPFDLFDNTMQPVSLQPGLFEHLLGGHEQKQLNTAVWQQTSLRYHGSFPSSLLGFLEYRASTEESEASDHFRNDSLLHMLKQASRLRLLSHRDSVTSSTTDRSRLGSNLAILNYPPYVVVEERASSDDLDCARSDLQSKFKWIKHYDGLPFVFAIAIAGNLIEFGHLDRRSTFTPFLGPGGRGTACFDTSDVELGSIEGALHCVHAAINIGRYIRYMHQHCPPASLGVTRFNVVIQRSNNKSLRIKPDHVLKSYGRITIEQKERMKSFYKDTKDVPCLEHAEVTLENDHQVQFTVTPTGVMRFPKAHDSVALRRCLKDILTALAGCHKAGWIVVDIRPPNIILADDTHNNTDRYFLIDACEFACREGSSLPVNFAHPPAGWPGHPNKATAQWDLLMVAHMFSSRQYAQALDSIPHGAALRASLATGRSSAETLLQHAFFADMHP